MRKNILGSLQNTPRSLQRFSEHNDFGLDLKTLWLGVMVGLGVWLAAALLGLVWITFSGTGRYIFSVYVYTVGILGVILGGLAAGSRSEKKGWLHGLWVGILLALCGIITNLELIPQSYTWFGMLRQLLLWAFWGLTGGHLGHKFAATRPGKTIGRRG